MPAAFGSVAGGAGADTAPMTTIDTNSLPVTAQLQLSQLSLVSSEMSSLEPAPAATVSVGDTTSLVNDGVQLDLSDAAPAYVTGQPIQTSDAAPGPGWEAGYDDPQDQEN